jgi:pimeloyl-ACP methyl ester carboxylesterase
VTEGRFVTLPAGRVHVRVEGPEDGNVVVLVHGLTISSVMWSPNVPPLLAAGFRVVRMDNFGRGLSDRPWRRNDASLFDDQLLGVLDALGMTQAVDLIGGSMGGAIAAVFAASHPERVRRLVLIAPAGKLGRAWAVRRVLHVPVLGDLLFQLFGSRLLVGRMRRESMDAASMEAMESDQRDSLRRPGYLRSVVSTIRHFPLIEIGDVYERVGRTGIRTLVIWGDRDGVVPYAGAHLVMAAMPGARLVTVPGATHVVSVSEAPLVNREIVGFLAGP